MSKAISSMTRFIFSFLSKDMMNGRLAFMILLVGSGFALKAQKPALPLLKPIVNDMKITSSVKIRQGIYRIEAGSSLTKPVIIIEGKDITVDFNQATLQGSGSKKFCDEYSGVAILIRNSKNVVIKNLNARGYKVALLARDVEGLTVEGCDFSYNYRQRLKSNQEKEDTSDWLSYHHNENDEWLRYGAAIYLRNCDSASISSCKVTGGQNALMMVGCNDGRIINNNFSFNSGVGLGMYRCNRNQVMYNSINFNVRGYSDGVYNRGQDSAGILVYEQSNDNLFYKNSVTHGGDGFFLWAGQSTMDSGQGGCNDNRIMNNDFSYAVANGVEITFSRNLVSDNRIFECDYGIWGGYSYSSNLSNNKFRNNRIDIAIENGQYNKITYNIFYDSRTAIQLWARAEQPADWGYPKYRDTKSRDYAVAFNNFNHCDTVLNIRKTDSIRLFGNIYGEIGELFEVDSSVTNLDTTLNEALSVELSTDTAISIADVNNPNDPFKGRGLLAGRKNILITEWGPYDFQYPLIWNTNPTAKTDSMRFNILGPKGKWKIKRITGVKDVSLKEGVFPAAITALRLPGQAVPVSIELEYTGASFTNQFGTLVPGKKPVLFAYKEKIP